ncbi:hypothetical protein K8R78_01740 [bacterium]|nr:hypothetical protein [bacterium]
MRKSKLRLLVLAFALTLVVLVPFITSCGYSDAELKEYDDAKSDKESADSRLAKADQDNEDLDARVEQKESELERARQNLAEKKAAYEEWEATN